MRFFSIAVITAALVFAGHRAESRPTEKAELLGPAQDPHVLTIMPPIPFAVDSRLRKNVDFWVKVYTEYSSAEGLIHDAKYIDHVYEVIDLDQPGMHDGTVIRRAKKHWKNVLLSLHRKQTTEEPLTADEEQVRKLFEDVQEPNKFLAAAHRKRLRFQLGQKDRFIQGLYYSGRYLTQMEEIFRREGLPVELTRLPFVESSFNVRARSKVGASGIWQFMRSTGRLFLKINDAVDERNDPIRATEAAAKLLRMNYESLRSWPLAVTAYNHGRKGMMRAVRKVGSEELEDVVNSFRSRSFGFASSNFFTELLASIEAEKNAQKYFGKIERGQPSASVEVALQDYIDLRQLAKSTNLDLGEIQELNPALSEAVFRGDRLVPAGYVLRIPYDGKSPKDSVIKDFETAYAAIPASSKLQAQKSGYLGTRYQASVRKKRHRRRR